MKQKRLGTKTLETERLILRKFTLNDAELVYKNWANDNEVTKYLTWKTHDNINVTKAVLENWVSNYRKDNFYQWAIILKETNEPIGSIGAVKQNDEVKMVHIGYCIGKKWWHKGITSEALKIVIKYFFDEVGINEIESRYDSNNQNSGKVMRKCGMKYKGTIRETDKNNQYFCDYYEYKITSKEYYKKT